MPAHVTKGETINTPKSVQPTGIVALESIAYFDPETIEVLAHALDEAWSRIEKSGSPLTRPAYARAMREVFAKRIIEMAQQGVKDPDSLADDAVRFVAANYSDTCKA